MKYKRKPPPSKLRRFLSPSAMKRRVTERAQLEALAPPCEAVEGDGWYFCHKCGSHWNDVICGKGWKPLSCWDRKAQRGIYARH